jgi:hypothetical protein
VTVKPSWSSWRAPLEAPEYDLPEGFALGSKIYDRPLRPFPIEHPTMRMLLDPLPPAVAAGAALRPRRAARSPCRST